MGVRQASKHELTMALRERYRKASRTERGQLLDTYVEATGYHRKYALTLLRHGPPVARPRLVGPGRPLTYSPLVINAVQVVAEATGWICGKRMAPALAELVPALEREGALVLLPQVRLQLLQLSAATIDRRLAALRKTAKPHGIATTKPGSLLKRQVPVRTYTPWDEQRPGFVEVDLVAHCGSSAAGEFAFTLDMTDIATGWTECGAVANKGQRAVLAMIEEVRARFPFPLLGIDSDNGSEFLNGHLIRYCQSEHLTYTRGRTYHKNDQAHVEQKNWSVVRQLVGYDRLTGLEVCSQLNRLYRLLHVYLNGYLPVMKLVGKERIGAKVHKRYDIPRTPYRRAQQAAVVPETTQQAFEALLAAHGPLGLRRQIDGVLEQIWRLREGADQAVAPATA
jgi:hypothetical protein